MVAIAKEHQIWVVQDLAYADICFDGYVAPSILQVPGAKEIAVEFLVCQRATTCRVGALDFVATLSWSVPWHGSRATWTWYLYPDSVAAIAALEGDQQCVADITEMYRSRRDVMCDGLEAAGWPVERPKATMFVWARIPEQYRHMGSLEFAKKLLIEAKVAVSPGIGFGDYGDEYVRIALIENEHRTRQAIRGIKKMLQKDAANAA